LFRVRSASTIGAGCIGAPIGVAEYKEDACVQCALPIFIPIAYKLSLTNRKRKYVAEKTTSPLKSKQTSITTVRCPILSVSQTPDPLIFRYPLPLIVSKAYFLKKNQLFKKRLLKLVDLTVFGKKRNFIIKICLS
jgi:hypothetical protein